MITQAIDHLQERALYGRMSVEDARRLLLMASIGLAERQRQDLAARVNDAIEELDQTSGRPFRALHQTAEDYDAQGVLPFDGGPFISAAA